MKSYNAVTSILWMFLASSQAFLQQISSNHPLSKTTTRRYNFFKDILDNAFQNDPTLSTTESNKGMIEGPNAVEPEAIAAPTEVQKAWRERQRQSSGGIDVALLENTQWKLELYLSGIPESDPSNNLYGSRVNISNRNKQLGVDLPPNPNAHVVIQILPDGICQALPSPLTSGDVAGQWKVSDDSSELRFSMNVMGYSRTIQTKGSIEKIYWSQQEEVSRQTTSTYEIPPGLVYGDISLQMKRPGVLEMEGDGLLRVEQRTGLLGAGTKLVTCGKFTGRMDCNNEKDTNIV